MKLIQIKYQTVEMFRKINSIKQLSSNVMKK